LTQGYFVEYCHKYTSGAKGHGKGGKMPKLTIQLAEDILRDEVHRLDKRVQLIGVSQAKKKDEYRVTLLKDGRTGSASIKKDLIKEYLATEGKSNALRKAIGKAVSHLSIQYR
jgi:hypothetical protein